MLEHIKTEFRNRFGEGGSVYASPGRINLIGEHTDYNLGFVLPGAIDKAIYAVIKPNGTNEVRLYSADYGKEDDFNINGTQPSNQWSSYVYGVIQEMIKRGATLGGFDAVFGGNVPLGAGLSSSAALESVFGFALNDLYGCGFSLPELAKIGQMTEHNYIGVKCGIMDQFASLHGKEGHVIKLDCRSLEMEYVPFEPDGCRLVLVDSMVKHSLASSEYNVRREQCEKGVAAIAAKYHQVKSLRDVTKEMLEEFRGQLEEVVYRRCAFIVGENERLLTGCEELKNGQYEEFGKKMYATHDGLSKDYEVSCEELDFIVDHARKHSDILGARMMGGGFGGCVIALIRNEGYDKFISDIKHAFGGKYGVEPRIIDVVISQGSHKIE